MAELALPWRLVAGLSPLRPGIDPAEIQKRTPRIQCKQPAQLWGRIWQNISRKHLTTMIRATWFRAVHDILPTNARLYNIRTSAGHPDVQDMWKNGHYPS
jgi:hypothetical protein